MLPVERLTTCTFGGRDLKTLYITSASSAEWFADGLFAVDVDVPGLPENRFRCFYCF
jgi:sugar lactone lactonase YvrE